MTYWLPRFPARWEAEGPLPIKRCHVYLLLSDASAQASQYGSIRARGNEDKTKPWTPCIVNMQKHLHACHAGINSSTEETSFSMSGCQITAMVFYSCCFKTIHEGLHLKYLTSCWVPDRVNAFFCCFFEPRLMWTLLSAAGRWTWSRHNRLDWRRNQNFSQDIAVLSDDTRL